MTRIILISDVHNRYHDLKIPDGDIICCSGDFTMNGHEHELILFRQWYSALPHGHKIVISGNHDKGLEFEHKSCVKALLGDTDIIYLQDSGVEVDGIKFYGAPWTPTFGVGWGFNANENKIRSMWSKIPSNVDVLLTHGPPREILDECLIGGKRAGCPWLLKAVKRVKPLVHTFGHIHEGYGFEEQGRTLFANASTCTFHYDPDNPPMWVDIENGKIVDYGP